MKKIFIVLRDAVGIVLCVIFFIIFIFFWLISSFFPSKDRTDGIDWDKYPDWKYQPNIFDIETTHGPEAKRKMEELKRRNSQ